MSEDKELERQKAEQAALYKYAAIRHAENDVVGAARIYVDITGDWEAALVLDELMFWTLPNTKTGKSGLRVRRDNYTWLAVSRADWWERKRLTPRQADRAVDKLINLGLAIKSVYKFNAQNTVHLRTNVSVFFDLLMSTLEKSYKDGDQEDNPFLELADLYALMGEPKSRLPNGELPNGETKLPNGETKLPNGNFINSTDHPSPSPTTKTENVLGDNLPLDWQIASGQKDLVMPSEDMQFQVDCEIAVMNICKGAIHLQHLAAAYIITRHALPSGKKKCASWKGAFESMYSAKPNSVYPEHVETAIRELEAWKPGCVQGPWSIVDKAISIANPMPETPPVQLSDIAV